MILPGWEAFHHKQFWFQLSCNRNSCSSFLRSLIGTGQVLLNGNYEETSSLLLLEEKFLHNHRHLYMAVIIDFPYSRAKKDMCLLDERTNNSGFDLGPEKELNVLIKMITHALTFLVSVFLFEDYFVKNHKVLVDNFIRSTQLNCWNVIFSLTPINFQI